MTVIIKLWTKFAIFNQIITFSSLLLQNRWERIDWLYHGPSASFKTIFKEQVFRLVVVACDVRKLSCEQWFNVFFMAGTKHSTIVSVREITRKQHGIYFKINEISLWYTQWINFWFLRTVFLYSTGITTFLLLLIENIYKILNWRLMNTLLQSFTELENVRQFTINYITNGTSWRLSLDTICRTLTEAWQFAIKIKKGSVSFRGLVSGFLSALVHSHVLLTTKLETALTVETLNSTRQRNVLGTWTKCCVVLNTRVCRFCARLIHQCHLLSDTSDNLVEIYSQREVWNEYPPITMSIFRNRIV